MSIPLRNKNTREGPKAVEILDEAVNLLRGAPLSTLALYYVSSAPFVMALLFYITDTGSGSIGGGYLSTASFALSALFLAMKTGQACFCAKLRSLRASSNEGCLLSKGLSFKAKLRAILSISLSQAALQPFGLLFIPVSAVVLFPLGWVYAFFQNATVYGAFVPPQSPEKGGLSPFTLHALSMRAARGRQLHNHMMLSALSLFGLFVFINVAAAVFLLPMLLNTFFGVETVFVKAGARMFNTSFMAITLGLTYLALDPVIKTAYVLRCFYEESRLTGEDLRVRLLRIKKGSQTTLMALTAIALILASAPAPLSANGQKISSPSGGISKKELQNSLNKVLSKRKYKWRIPVSKEELPYEEKSFIAIFMDGLLESIASTCDTVSEWIREGCEAMDGLFPKPGGHLDNGKSGGGWMDWREAAKLILALLALLALSVLIVVVYKKAALSIAAQKTLEDEPSVSTKEPDMEDEDVTADQLPTDRWLELAGDFLRQGNLRHATRAVFLAALARLSEHRAVQIEKHKTNGDYALELSMTARAIPEVLREFQACSEFFELIWYGGRTPDAEGFRHFKLTQERIYELSEKL